MKLGFYFRIKACFSFEARRRLVSASIMPLPDYGDIYMNGSAQCLRSIDTLYHGTLRCINCKTLTHHCTLYTRVGWPSLVTRRLSHWCTFIYKAILGLLPFLFGHFYCSEMWWVLSSFVGLYPDNCSKCPNWIWQKGFYVLCAIVLERLTKYF
jgi:hypothetical protein